VKGWSVAGVAHAGRLGVTIRRLSRRRRECRLATFAGATALAAQSDEPAAVLRERVTSKGGTTHAGMVSLDADGVKAAFVRALRAAQQRAAELGREN
jgi:pyrroline-5-carboxylate reductase